MTRPLVWLALDGVGHPADAPPGSPWETELPALRPLVDAGLALDAALGVPGLPQSATGQSCWLTGQDAVALMGEHYGPQPGPTLRRLLDASALPGRLTRAGGRAALLNLYPPGYFAAQQGRARHGCFPYSFLSVGLELNPPGLPLLSPTLGMGYLPPWQPLDDPDDWARRGAEVAAVRDHDLLVLDLWFSDLLGHRGRAPTLPELHAAARAYLGRLDRLVAGLLEGGARLALSSDHGNFEDLTRKTHTRARVPFAGVGLELGRPADIREGGRVLAASFGLGS